MDGINLRISELIKLKNHSISSFEKEIGAGNNSIGISIRRNSSVSGNTLNKILNTYSDVNPNWLITGKGPMLISHAMEDDHLVATEEVTIPIFDLIAGRNYVATESEATEFINPGDLFRDAQAVMRVYGNSMETKYPSGCFVPVKILDNKSLCVPGQDYVIQTKEYRVLKRVQKSKKENHIMACSINQETYHHGELSGKLIHEPFDVNIDDIVSISIVLGCVTRNQISNIR